MDWNWFFSAIAQCSAAIVGIFGAFIITKIISNQDKFNKKKNEIDQMINKSDFLKDKAKNRDFKWYTERRRKDQLDEIKDSIMDGDEILPPEQYYINYNFSIYDDRNKIIDDIQTLIDETRQTTHNNNFAVPLPEGNAVYESQLISSIHEEGEFISDLTVKIQDHIRLLEILLQHVKSNPEKSNLITFSILSNLVLFILGVIYPLSFLPVGKTLNISLSLTNILDTLFSLKGLMLITVGLIFTAIMVVFLIVNMRLNYNKEEIEQINELCDIKNYNDYYKNMVNNQQFLNENNVNQ